jgi:transcriptional regulator with XRE-family HTH domain
MQNSSKTGLPAQRVVSDTSFEGGESMAGKRHGLVSTRKAAGFSQEQLAEAVGVERSTVMRWERGETRPQPWARPKLARALGISDQALSELLGEPAEPQREPSDLVQPWELADAMTHATISATTLDYMERAVFSYATRYPSTPPAVLLPEVSAQLPRLRGVLNRPQPLRTRRRAVTLLGVLSGLAGNLWVDLGREDHAAEFFDVGELAGHEAEDPDLTAWVLATRSIGAFFAGQHRNATDLLARAQDAAALRSSPRRRAWVAALQARSAAARGDHFLSRTALERAHQHLAAVSGPPSGTEFFDAPRLDGLAGTTYLLMNDTHRAIPLLTQARGRRASTDVKGRALVTLDLAECHVVDHEPEETVRLATHALDGVDGSMVAPIVVRARRLHARLERWPELIGGAGARRPPAGGARWLMIRPVGSCTVPAGCTHPPG